MLSPRSRSRLRAFGFALLYLLYAVAVAVYFASVLRADCAIDPPYYPPLLDGPVCSVERQEIPCGCSESFTWSPAVRADFYRIERETISTGTIYQVGEQRPRVVDESGATEVRTVWEVAKDSPFPRAGTRYRYRVVACRYPIPSAGETEPVCSAPSESVVHVAAPYRCYEDGSEVACYVGDSVR